MLFGVRPNGRSKAAWVMQTQNALRRDQVHVVVLTRFCLRGGEI